MTQKKPLSQTLVRQLADILRDTDLTEIEYESEQGRIRVARNHAPMPAQDHGPTPSSPSPTPTMAPPPALPQGDIIKAPMVGTVYLSPSPEAPPFIQVGQEVKEGDTLLIIEAMKVMNPIRATKSGIVKDIMVENADPIEFDHPLILMTS